MPPDLFFILGQARQGKSTLTRHFRTSLDCVVIQTDQLFWRWCDVKHPKATRKARKSLGRYFPHLSASLRREWFEFMTNYVLSKTVIAKPDIVLEGWLLTKLPTDLRTRLGENTNFIKVTMRNYVAYACGHTFKSNKRNYASVVVGLRKLAAEKRKTSP